MNVAFRPFAYADGLTVKQSMPFNFSQDVRGIVAYDKDTFDTLAVLVAQDWTHTTVQVHQVILKTMVIRHGWFQEISEWLFTAANRIKLLAPVVDDNVKALGVNEKLGFKEILRIEDGFALGKDLILMELKPEDVPARYWTPRRLAEVA